MKKKDLTLIAVISVISLVFSLVLSSAIIGSPEKNVEQVEVVQKITTDFPEPDERYYNKEAIDPTKVITIGNNNNPAPFSTIAQ